MMDWLLNAAATMDDACDEDNGGEAKERM